MTRTVSIDEAKEKLRDLLAQALAGNEVISQSTAKRLLVWFSFQSLRRRRSASQV